MLAALLKADPLSPDGPGPMHQRIFNDDSIYREFYELTSWEGREIGGRKEKTEAQGRLLGLLESLAAFDFDLISR